MTAAVLENLAVLAVAPDGVAKLRALVLDLAIHGRLCSQVAEDEPATLLVAQAKQTEQVGMKVRKARVSADIDSNLEPREAFPLPVGWSWARVGDIADVIRGVTYSKGDASDGPAPGLIPLLRGNNINGNLNFEKLVYVPATLVSEDQRVRAGDMVIAMSSGSADLVGKAAQAIEDFSGGFGAFCGVVRSRSSDLLPYLAFFFRTPFYRAIAAGKGKGIGINNLQKSALQALPIPIPPLAEQHRIVAKVDELMALCDRLEARQQDAEAAHARLVQALLDSLTQARDAEEFQACWERVAIHFGDAISTPEAVDGLRNRILTMALQGRLVEPSGFTIPMLPLADLTTQITDGTHKTPTYALSGVKFLSAKNVRMGVLDMMDCRYVSLAEHQELTKRCRPEFGDILLSKSGSIGTAVLVETDEPFSIFESLALLKPKRDRVTSAYLRLAIQEACFRLDDSHVKGVGVKHLHLNVIRKLEISTPSIEMQHRIVAKVTELLALCDQLKARIAAARAKHAQLAEALVAQAVAG